jgi:hypothetical protein
MKCEGKRVLVDVFCPEARKLQHYLALDSSSGCWLFFQLLLFGYSAIDENL